MTRSRRRPPAQGRLALRARAPDGAREVAEGEGHHPDFCVSWNRVKLELITHAIGGLSENDFIMAAKINASIEGS